MKEKIFRAVIGNVNVIPSVVVEVRRGHAHGAAHVSADARLLGHVRKGSVTVVVIELVGFALIIERPRVVVRRVKGAILGIELHVAAYEKIDASILVVIEPGGTDRPAVHIDPGLLGHIGEVAVAVVVIENRLAVSGDQQIDKAVVVIVGRCHGDPVHIRIEAGLLRHIGKGAVSVVAIKMIVRRRCGLIFERIRMHRVVQRTPVDHIE